MDGTPRLRSAFPATPQRDRRDPRGAGSARQMSAQQRPLPPIQTLSKSTSSPNEPLIPESYIDAPSQRLYAAAIWVVLWTLRIYDFTGLQESEEQSLWLFMKWVAIDGIFLFGLPGLRIPWLEWSSATITLIFLAHAFLDGMLMFRIPLPVGAGLAVLWRGIWGYYETALNEHNVNPDTVLFNDSLILGRQVIHILPEGSAILNVEREAFCLDPAQGLYDVKLPITINATNPVAMELVRDDLDSAVNETLYITKSQIKTMHREASRLLSYGETPNQPRTLYYQVKKPGIYTLSKVVDETNLEVSRRHQAHTVVVPCPKAVIISPASHKCRGDISEIRFDISGTPPLKLKYRKIRPTPSEASIESIQPEDLDSPLLSRSTDGPAVPLHVERQWARARTMTVPLSESLGSSGKWTYVIDEVVDGFGNRHTYTHHDSAEEKDSSKARTQHQTVNVHERPTVHMEGCSPQKPLNVAKGQPVRIPLSYGFGGHEELGDAEFQVQYSFSPLADMSATGEHRDKPEVRNWTVQAPKRLPEIQEPGLYTITGISTGFCAGEVLEPDSCLLQNPPEPQLSISEQEIFDRCAGSPIGLRVDLDLIGTPPFLIQYRMQREGDRHHVPKEAKLSGMRGQLELTPDQAGRYTYNFVSISDAVYQSQPLRNLQLTQAVKPSANARFTGTTRKVACIDSAADFDVTMSGEGPFNIEYELVHAGKRVKYDLHAAMGNSVQLQTEQLKDGGDYTLALISIVDGNGCKEFLKEEAKIAVGHQKPKVGFAHIGGRHTVEVLEGDKVSLPVRLAGDGPWRVEYLDGKGALRSQQLATPNDKIAVQQEGTVQLKSVQDNACPGTVDDLAKDFTVNWIARPEMRIADTDAKQRDGDVVVKMDVCEGDDDAINMLFKGAPPYTMTYEQHAKLNHGTVAPRKKEMKAIQSISTVRLDTSQAGVYEYRFTSLEDHNYKLTPRQFTPLKVRQTVFPRPSAAFKTPGKTYGFCSVESEGEEVIPVTLHGKPPFDLEVEIKHHGSIKPELVSYTHIESTSYDVRIPRSRLHIGKSAVSLRRVSDARGCSRSLDSTMPRVQISVHDAPTLTPLETQQDYCVGERLNFGLSGIAPFQIFYTFNGVSRKATVSSGNTFRRLAEKPGTFTITGVQDSSSACKAMTHITKHIHGMPSVRVSKGKDSYVDIHEGGQAEVLFEFGGSPPFEFTYTRSSNTDKGGKKGVVLDMRSEISDEYSMRIWANQEGTYEVVAIKDAHCAYSKPGVKVDRDAVRRLGY